MSARLSYAKVFSGDINELTRRVAELSVRKILGNSTTATLLYFNTSDRPVNPPDNVRPQIIFPIRVERHPEAVHTLSEARREGCVRSEGEEAICVLRLKPHGLSGVSGARPCIATTDALSEWVYYTPFDRFSPTNPSSVIQLTLNAYYETIGDAIRVCGSGTPEYTELKVIIEVNGYGKQYSSTVLHIKGSEVNTVNNLYYSLVNVLGGGSAIPLEMTHS